MFHSPLNSTPETVEFNRDIRPILAESCFQCHGPLRIGNHIWYNYLDKRPVESSYWLLPTANHYLQWDAPEEMAGIVRTCLEVEIPAPEDENAFMRELARNRTATSPVYMGRSIIENVYFPRAVDYSPDGYSF